MMAASLLQSAASRLRTSVSLMGPSTLRLRASALRVRPVAPLSRFIVLAFVSVIVGSALNSCKVSERPPAFAEAQNLGGVGVPAETLNRGHSFFMLHCAACHGATGSGQGPVGVTQIPAPRDLRLGLLKYASVPAGALPTDADLHHLMVTGLKGTGMAPWRFRDEEIEAVTQYVKTLGPRWRTEKPGTPVHKPVDPFEAATAEVVARGKGIYHGAVANCTACHPSYDSTAQQPPRENAGEPLETDTSFGKIVAPDLTKATRRVGNAPADVFQVIAAGIGGTGMTGMDGRLEPADLWALTYYVVSLQPAH